MEIEKAKKEILKRIFEALDQFKGTLISQDFEAKVVYKIEGVLQQCVSEGLLAEDWKPNIKFETKDSRLIMIPMDKRTKEFLEKGFSLI